MRHALAAVIAIYTLSGIASAQTSDGGFDKALSTSAASSAKAMFATIRRDAQAGRGR